jgi:transcriptional regulator with XRE-family HTH domain
MPYGTLRQVPWDLKRSQGINVARTTKKDPTPFGRYLLARLSDSGLSRPQFADRVNVHSSRVSKWIYSVRPSPSSCELIADVLVLPLEEVLNAAGYPVSQPTESVGMIRAEAVRLIEAMPESLLLPYVVGMRAIVGYPEPTRLREQVKAAVLEEEGED